MSVLHYAVCAMATGVRAKAIEQKETHFIEWFDELIGKAEALRADLVRH